MAKRKTPQTPKEDFEVWEFDLEPQERKVKIGGEDYILKEASEDAACKWRNQTLAGARMADGKLVGMGNVSDGEPLLVSLCLWKATGKKDNVSPAVVRAWPSRVVKKLFAWIEEVSDLAEDKETAKNEQSDTPDS